MLLSNLVVIMAVQGYLFIQQSILKLEARFAIKQKIDIADFYLRQDIQSAGYRGYSSCDNNLLDLNHIKNWPNTLAAEPIVFTRAITPDVHIRDLPEKIAHKILQQKLKYNSSILFIKDVPKAIYKLATPMLDPCAALQVHNATELNDGAWAAIADVNVIERFVVSKIIAGKYIYHQLPENNTQCLQNTYTDAAEIIALQWVAYYLAKESINDTTYTLYRDDLNNNAEGLIDGVEDFYVQLITHNSSDDEQNIATNLIGVEIGLLLKSDGNYFKQKEILWRGKVFKFKDKALREPVNFKVALRNVC